MRNSPALGLLPLLVALGASTAACGNDPAAGGAATGGSGGGGGSGASGGTAGAPQLATGILRRQGQLLVGENGAPTLLRGVAFGNNVWGGLTTPPQLHHDERDFERLNSWGMNAVRFYLNYQLFEDDAAPFVYKQTGFDWIDQNVAWAKAHGVYLILNLHYPQGGFQSNGDGDALWTVPANQDRFVALWRAIAERYAAEPTIAGFDFLNEPRPTTSAAEWQDLAARVVTAVREVDPAHLVFVERTNSVGEDWSNDADQNFFLVPDDNAVYEFHFYSPIEYTHQLASWTTFGEGGKYPDESLISVSGQAWYDWAYSPAPPSVPAGDSDWTLYESPRYVIADPLITLARPGLVAERIGGTASFDDLVVKEYDASGTFVRNVLEVDLETMDGFSFWKEPDSAGTAAVSTEAHTGSGSLSITGTDHDANLASTQHYFVPQQGYSYSVSVWMKGAGINDATFCRTDPRGTWQQCPRAIGRLEYYSGGTVATRNKAALAAELERFVAWGRANDVPLYLGEFGLIYHCFENDRGGLNWVNDMLDLLLENDVSFTYHSYHEWSFPIFQSDPTVTLPDLADANVPLIELFQAKLGGL